MKYMSTHFDSTTNFYQNFFNFIFDSAQKKRIQRILFIGSNKIRTNLILAQLYERHINVDHLVHWCEEKSQYSSEKYDAIIIDVKNVATSFMDKILDQINVYFKLTPVLVLKSKNQIPIQFLLTKHDAINFKFLNSDDPNIVLSELNNHVANYKCSILDTSINNHLDNDNLLSKKILYNN